MPGMIMTRCPHTGVAIPTGIMCDWPTFDGLAETPGRVRCNACGHEHAWALIDAWLDRSWGRAGGKRRRPGTAQAARWEPPRTIAGARRSQPSSLATGPLPLPQPLLAHAANRQAG